jgi:hypothetical protein
MRISSRHTVVAAGTRSLNPSRADTGRSRSRTQSLTAANVHAPASTAHTATASTLTSAGNAVRVDHAGRAPRPERATGSAAHLR